MEDVKFVLAQLVCYHGDGILWTRLYQTSNKDVHRYISEIAQLDLEKDDWYIGSGQGLVVRDITPENI